MIPTTPSFQYINSNFVTSVSGLRRFHMPFLLYDVSWVVVGTWEGFFM